VSFIMIQTTDEARLKGFETGDVFKGFLAPRKNPRVSRGTAKETSLGEFVEFFEDEPEAAIVAQNKEAKGAVHWILIEDDNNHDNVTYWLGRSGLEFFMSGVEF